MVVHEGKEASSSEDEQTDTAASSLQLEKALQKMKRGVDRTNFRLLNLTKIGYAKQM